MIEVWRRAQDNGAVTGNVEGIVGLNRGRPYSLGLFRCEGTLATTHAYSVADYTWLYVGSRSSECFY
jgi:hypothetical protein